MIETEKNILNLKLIKSPNQKFNFSNSKKEICTFLSSLNLIKKVDSFCFNLDFA